MNCHQLQTKKLFHTRNHLIGQFKQPPIGQKSRMLLKVSVQLGILSTHHLGESSSRHRPMKAPTIPRLSSSGLNYNRKNLPTTNGRKYHQIKHCSTLCWSRSGRTVNIYAARTASYSNRYDRWKLRTISFISFLNLKDLQELSLQGHNSVHSRRKPKQAVAKWVKYWTLWILTFGNVRKAKINANIKMKSTEWWNRIYLSRSTQFAPGNRSMSSGILSKKCTIVNEIVPNRDQHFVTLEIELAS